MAPIFTQERLKDGYYRRIKAVDDIMGDKTLKIYMSHSDTTLLQGNNPSVAYIDENHIRIAYFPWIESNRIWVNRVADLADVAYHHGVGYIDEDIIRNKKILKVVDLHGVLPEEFAMSENYKMVQTESYHEELAMKYADYIVCVTNKMVLHMKKKYSDCSPKYIVMPILDQETLDSRVKCEKKLNDNIVVTYAGGTQKWQMIEKMQEAMQEQDNLDYRIFVPYPDEFWKTWKSQIEIKSLKVKSCNPEELREEYKNCQYGFVLREDITVNNVACPTKLIEYLLMGIVPILNTSNLGDFDTYGMYYISINEFVNGKFPDEEERWHYAIENQLIIDKIIDLYKTCRNDIQRVICGE